MLTPLIKRLKRKRLHRDYLFNRTYEIHNNIMTMLLSSDSQTPIKVIRKVRKTKGDKNSYIICKITEEDLNLLTDIKGKIKLVKKYRRRLILLNV